MERIEECVASLNLEVLYVPIFPSAKATNYSMQARPQIKSNLIASVAKAKEYLKSHPYCIPTYVQLARRYNQLSYPDLAVGALYKALLLSDAVRDDSDEYHESAVEDVLEWIASISSSDGQRMLGTECNELAKASPHMALEPFVLEKLLPQM